jgi:hypothetical protein
LDSVKVEGDAITDTVLTPLLGSFQRPDMVLKKFDLGNNEFGDMSVETLTSFFGVARVHELVLVRTKVTEFGFQRFFRFFVRDHIDLVPRIIRFSFGTQDAHETAIHNFFNDLATLVAENSPLEELTISGSVTGVDLTTLLSGLSKNSTLRKIVLLTEIPEKYKAPNPTIETAIQGVFTQIVRQLHRALLDEWTVCRLETFEYPVLTTVFLIGDEIQGLWDEIEAKLTENQLANGSR